MSSDTPIIARAKPFLVSVEQGKRYLWCACGRSKTQPFCDGSHAGTELMPISFTAEKTKDILLCGCKHTRSSPYCDGAHNNLEDTYEEATADEIAAMKNAAVVSRNNGIFGKALLDGGAYVLTPDMASAEKNETLSILQLISRTDGANRLSLAQIKAQPGRSAWRRHDDSEVVLFVVSGRGVINIEEKPFNVGPETGVFVKRGEAYCVEATEEMRLMAAICPEPEAESHPVKPEGRFDTNLPVRCVAVADAQSNVMADRFYQILVGEEIGSSEVTQFIGGIPKSRAVFHRHLYEEAIVILSGEGVMWTKTRCAPVKPGDVIFLPARQGHSLECTVDEGMRLMGAFYPAGSPAINY